MSGHYRPSAHSTDVEYGYTIQSYQGAAPQPVASGVRYVEPPGEPFYPPCSMQSQQAQQQHQSGFSYGALQRYGPSHDQSEQISHPDHRQYLASLPLPLLPPPQNKRPPLSEEAQQQHLRGPSGPQNLPPSEGVSYENWQSRWSLSGHPLHSQGAPLSDSDWGPTQNQQYEQPASTTPHTPLYTQHPLSLPSVLRGPQTTEPQLPSHSLQQPNVTPPRSQGWPVPSQLWDASGGFAPVTAADPSADQFHRSSLNAHLQTLPASMDQSPHSSEQSSSSNRASPIHISPLIPPQGNSYALQNITDPVPFRNPGAPRRQSPCMLTSNGGNHLAPSLSATLMFPSGGVSTLPHSQSTEPRTLALSGAVEQSQHRTRTSSHKATSHEVQGQQNPSFHRHKYQPQHQHRHMSQGRTTDQSQRQHMAPHLRPRKAFTPSSQDISASSLPVGGTPAARSQVPLAPAASAAVQGLAKRCAQAAKATRVSRGVGSASGTSRSSMSSVSSAGPANTFRPGSTSSKLLNGTSSSSPGESQATASGVPLSEVTSHGSAAHSSQQSIESYTGQAIQQFSSNSQYPACPSELRPTPDASSQAQELFYGGVPPSEGLPRSQQPVFVPAVKRWNTQGDNEVAFEEQDRQLTSLVVAQPTRAWQTPCHQEQVHFHTPAQPTLSSQHHAQPEPGPHQALEAHTGSLTQNLRQLQTQQPSPGPIQFLQTSYSSEFFNPQAYHTAHGGEVQAQADDQCQSNAQVQMQMRWSPWFNHQSHPPSQH